MADESRAPGTGASLDGVRIVSLDVRWNTGAQTALGDRLGIAAMPLVRDRVESREHVVHSNQPATPDETTRLGISDGVVEVDLAAAPADVERIVVLAEVVRGDAGWRVEFTGRGYDAGLDAAMQQAGSRL